MFTELMQGTMSFGTTGRVYDCQRARRIARAKRARTNRRTRTPVVYTRFA